MKTFDCVGVSTSPAGEVKYRVANGSAARIKHLKQVGHTNVMLFDTPVPMTKEVAIDWFRANYEHLTLDVVAAATSDRMTAFDAEMALLMEQQPGIYDEAVAEPELPEEEAVVEEAVEEVAEEATEEEATEEEVAEEVAEEAPKPNKRKRKR